MRPLFLQFILLFSSILFIPIESALAAADPCSLAVDSSAIYLNNSGACGKTCSDSNAGTFAAPLCTLTSAMSKTAAGGVLKVLPGVYRFSTTINRTTPITITGLSDPSDVVFTPAKAIDETLFTSDGNGIYSASVSALGLGSSTSLSVLVLDQGKRLYKDSAMGCTFSSDVSNSRLRVKLDGNPNPTAHTLEVVDTSQFGSGYLRFWNTSTGVDLDVKNVTIRGFSQYGIYLYKVNSTLNFDHVNFEMNTAEQIALYKAGGTVNLSNIIMRGSHNLSYWTDPGTLITTFYSDSSRVSTYKVTSTKIYPHNALGNFSLTNASSTATVDGLELYSAGVDHTGISLSQGGPGSLLVRNSVFASFDYTLDMKKPYACFFGKAYEDAAHDFLYSDGKAEVHARVENSLFAYGLFANQFQDPAAGSHISGVNNIFINNFAFIPSSFTVDEWDYNLYYNANDPYGSTIINLPGGGAVSTLAAAKAGWQSGSCATCDSHSKQEAPGLVKWARDEMMVYDFHPTVGSDLCGAGKGGKDIGPFSCATSSGPDTVVPAAPTGFRLQ